MIVCGDLEHPRRIKKIGTGSRTGAGSSGGASAAFGATDIAPCAIRVRSFCRSLGRSYDYELPTPLPALMVKTAPSEEKGPLPLICPLCVGRLTGPYLDQIEVAVEEWMQTCQPRKKRLERGQLRRLSYRFRWAPRGHDSRPY